MANGSIVALCGLKSRHGSACIVKHIYIISDTQCGKHAYHFYSQVIMCSLNEIHIYEPAVICINNQPHVKNLFE